MDIKWSVGMSYMDIYNKVSFVSYSVSAKNKDTAQLIAKELFLMDIGVCAGITDIVIEPERLTTSDKDLITEVRDKIYRDLCNVFTDKSYQDFVYSYNQYGGFNAVVNASSLESYWINFMDLIVKIVFVPDSGCKIDTREIYYSCNLGKCIVARNSWSEFYYFNGGI